MRMQGRMAYDLTQPHSTHGACTTYSSLLVYSCLYTSKVKYPRWVL